MAERSTGPSAVRLRLTVSSGDHQGARCDRPFTAQLRVRLADTAGHGEPGQRISFRVVSGPARFGRGAVAATARTDATGTAIAPVLSAQLRPGPVNVTAVVVGSAEIRPASFVLRVMPAR